MSRTHFIKCDQCEEPMLLQSVINNRTQNYRCHHCADRWAAALLNGQGGVNSVLYDNGTNIAKHGLAVATGNLLGEVFSKRKSR